MQTDSPQWQATRAVLQEALTRMDEFEVPPVFATRGGRRLRVDWVLRLIHLGKPELIENDTVLRIDTSKRTYDIVL